MRLIHLYGSAASEAIPSLIQVMESERYGMNDASAAIGTIGIGDGGNEIGMGKIHNAIASLDINASVTSCDELLVADVSNWGAYGLIAFLDLWSGKNLLDDISPSEILEYLSARGSVDGVTRENTLTEDGLDAEEGYGIIRSLRDLVRKK